MRHCGLPTPDLSQAQAQVLCGPEGGSSDWVGTGRKLHGMGVEEWALESKEAMGGGFLQKSGSKYPGYVPLLHQVTKCKFKDKTIKNFKTTITKHYTPSTGPF